MRFLRVRKRRLQLKHSVFELARRCGVSPLTVRLWERGLATPSTVNLGRLERVLGRKWEWLKQEVAS